MTTSGPSGWRVSGIAPVVGFLVVITLVAGHPAVAEVASGAVILLAAVALSGVFARRAVVEPDPGRHLILDALMVLLVLLALVGAGLIGLAIPAASA
jgi:hypothetical protein